MSERLKVTPLESHIILVNEIFTRHPQSSSEVPLFFKRGHYSDQIAKALHGYDWQRWFFPDNKPVKPEQFLGDSTKSQLLMDTVDRTLETIQQRRRQIVRLRFGFNTGIIPVLEDIAEEVGITKSRVGQILEISLKQLRHPSRSKELKQFLPETEDSQRFM